MKEVKALITAALLLSAAVIFVTVPVPGAPAQIRPSTGVPAPIDAGPDTAVVEHRQELLRQVRAFRANGGTGAPLSITTISLVNGTQATVYGATLAASGGATPYAWSLSSGSLPTGLSLSSSGSISGTPMIVGSFSFTVQVRDGAATTASKTLGITVAAETPPPNTSGLAFYVDSASGSDSNSGTSSAAPWKSLSKVN